MLGLLLYVYSKQKPLRGQKVAKSLFCFPQYKVNQEVWIVPPVGVVFLYWEPQVPRRSKYVATLFSMPPQTNLLESDVISWGKFRLLNNVNLIEFKFSLMNVPTDPLFKNTTIAQ